MEPVCKNFIRKRNTSLIINEVQSVTDFLPIQTNLIFITKNLKQRICEHKMDGTSEVVMDINTIIKNFLIKK